MSTDNQTVRDIMIPLSGFPCMKESGTVQEAIQQLRSFCPISSKGSSGPCGFSELMVVDDKGGLIGRVTQQGILRVLFSSLLDPIAIKPFEGRTIEYSDLATLLDGVPSGVPAVVPALLVVGFGLAGAVGYSLPRGDITSDPLALISALSRSAARLPAYAVRHARNSRARARALASRALRVTRRQSSMNVPKRSTKDAS